VAGFVGVTGCICEYFDAGTKNACDGHVFGSGTSPALP
jgi:hypothetical protein